MCGLLTGSEHPDCPNGVELAEALRWVCRPRRTVPHVPLGHLAVSVCFLSVVHSLYPVPVDFTLCYISAVGLCNTNSFAMVMSWAYLTGTHWSLNNYLQLVGILLLSVPFSWTTDDAEPQNVVYFMNQTTKRNPRVWAFSTGYIYIYFFFSIWIFTCLRFFYSHHCCMCFSLNLYTSHWYILESYIKW